MEQRDVPNSTVYKHRNLGIPREYIHVTTTDIKYYNDGWHRYINQSKVSGWISQYDSWASANEGDDLIKPQPVHLILDDEKEIARISDERSIT